MARMLEEYSSAPSLRAEQIVSGTVVRVDATEVIVDINAKCDGIVPQRDLEQMSLAERQAIRAGDQVLVYVVDPDDAGGSIILSLSRAQLARDWAEAQRLLESHEIVSAPVVGSNRGGLIVGVGKVRGFVPFSLLGPGRSAGPAAQAGEGESRGASLVGQTITLKVIEVDQPRSRLVLSEREAIRDSQGKRREELLGQLKEGDIRRGRIASLSKFGAFVDLGGVDGLVHISELSWKRVLEPQEAVTVGQEVDVCVIGVDRERQRIALSIRRLQPDPWASVEARYRIGQLVDGTITRLTQWGAFASLVGDEAIEGLIHISELDDGQTFHPQDRVQPHQVVTLRVIGVDAARHRLALSLKQVHDAEFLDQDWKEALAADQPRPEGSLSAALARAMGPVESGENSDPDGVVGQ